MNLTSKESALVFLIMQDLTGAFGNHEIRQRLGEKLLDLLQADFFASYVWDDAQQKFSSCIQINMSAENLQKYETYYQFHDPITPILQKRKSATAVSEIMRHEQLVKTEFYNDFLARDGLCYGLTYFAYDHGDNIGDIRVWRKAGREDFNHRDTMLVDAIGPSLVNALIRANSSPNQTRHIRFVQLRENFALTKREAEIADLLVIGLSDREIYAMLGISKPTLRSHIGAIFSKTNLQRRSQLARLLLLQNHHKG